MYVQQGLSTHQIARQLRVSPTTVARWLRLAGVELRTKRAAMRLRCNQHFRLTPTTRALLDGLLLGGAAKLRRSDHGESWLVITRPATQTPWLQQLRTLLNQRGVRVGLTTTPGRTVTVNDRTISIAPQAVLRTRSYVELTRLHNHWQPADASVAPLALAHWWFGAGGATATAVRFNMPKFSWDDAAALRAKLFDTYGWRPTIHNGPRLALTDPEDRVALRVILQRHVPPCHVAKVNLV